MKRQIHIVLFLFISGGSLWAQQDGEPIAVTTAAPRESLETTLEHIIRKKAINILFEAALVEDKFTPGNLDFDQSAETLLVQALKEFPIDFERLDGRNYVLTRKQELEVTHSPKVTAIKEVATASDEEDLEKTVTGSVHDAFTGDPLIGVSISIKEYPSTGGS